MKDPAYPPSRQTVYLRVAEPRGLVVLKGAGVISPSVREFISTELKIRIEVPALELLPDGSIEGGKTAKSTEDVLKGHLQLADMDPNVAIGPDSVGTLSFTSGSTGIPKGVKGRHYSLTHFFPWMGERFGLTNHSKFTMLSGIAHDPIQRDSMSVVCLYIAESYVTLQCSPHSFLEHNCMSRQAMTSVPPVVWLSGWQIAKLLSRI